MHWQWLEEPREEDESEGRSLNTSLQVPFHPCSPYSQIGQCWHEIPVCRRRFTVFQGKEHKGTETDKWLESAEAEAASPPCLSQHGYELSSAEQHGGGRGACRALHPSEGKSTSATKINLMMVEKNQQSWVYLNQSHCIIYIKIRFYNFW